MQEMKASALQTQFDVLMEDWLKRRGECREDSYGRMEWAAQAGIHDGTRPQAPVTRAEVTDMLRRSLEYFFSRMLLEAERESFGS